MVFVRELQNLLQQEVETRKACHWSRQESDQITFPNSRVRGNRLAKGLVCWISFDFLAMKRIC